MNRNTQVMPLPIENNVPRMRQTFIMFRCHYTSYQHCLPAIRLGQALGLISWSSNHASSTKSTCGVWKQGLALLYKIIVAISAILFLAARSKLFFETGYDTAVTKIVDNAVGGLEIVFIFFVFMFCLFEEKRFNDVFELLLNADTLVTITTQTGKRYFNHCIVQAILTIICTFMRTLTGDKPFDFDTLVDRTSVWIVNATSLFVALFFIIIVNLTIENFAAVNEELRNALNLHSPTLIKPLEQLQHRYLQVYRTVASAQFAFSWLITVELAQLTSTLCLDSYFMLTRDFKLNEVVSALFVVLYMHRVFTISSVADSLTTQASVGLECLHNVCPKNVQNPEGFELQIVMILSNKLSQSPPAISSAWNLFRVNMNSFTSIMVTIITYLIIFIQFRTSATTVGAQTNATNSSGTK